MFFSKLAMALPLFSVMFLDFALTMLCQPSDYWQDHRVCNEQNVIGMYLLALCPWCFAAAFLVWFLGVAFVVTRYRRWRVVNLIAVIIFLGHALGSASWLPTVCGFFNVALPDMCLFLAYWCAIIFCISRSMRLSHAR